MVTFTLAVCFVMGYSQVGTYQLHKKKDARQVFIKIQKDNTYTFWNEEGEIEGKWRIEDGMLFVIPPKRKYAQVLDSDIEIKNTIDIYIADQQGNSIPFAVCRAKGDTASYGAAANSDGHCQMNGKIAKRIEINHPLFESFSQEFSEPVNIFHIQLVPKKISLLHWFKAPWKYKKGKIFLPKSKETKKMVFLKMEGA